MTTQHDERAELNQVRVSCAKAFHEVDGEFVELMAWLNAEADKWDYFGNKAVAKVLRKAAALLAADGKPVADGELPPLPQPWVEGWVRKQFDGEDLFTADQMRNYARAALLAEDKAGGEPVATGKVLCSVRGMPRPGAVCASAITGMKYCGAQSPCEFKQIERVTYPQPQAERVPLTPELLQSMWLETINRKEHKRLPNEIWFARQVEAAHGITAPKP